jgi:hypothetical protein
MSSSEGKRPLGGQRQANKGRTLMRVGSNGLVWCGLGYNEPLGSTWAGNLLKTRQHSRLRLYARSREVPGYLSVKSMDFSTDNSVGCITVLE